MEASSFETSAHSKFIKQKKIHVYVWKWSHVLELKGESLSS